MKVLIYSHYFFPSFGGVEKATYLLARYLEESGQEATVLTKLPTEEEDHYPFRVVRNPTIKVLLSEIGRADIVHLQGFVLLPFLLAKTLGRPVVWAHHGYDVTCPKQIGWKDGNQTSFVLSECVECLLRDHTPSRTFGLILLLFLKRFFLPVADVHVAPSRHLLAREKLRGLVIPNAVDVELYAPNEKKKVDGRVLFVGRLTEEKGITVLLEALDLLRQNDRNYDLCIVGSGHRLPQLRRLVHQMGLGGVVSFDSMLSDSELVAKMAEASVVCAPTLNAEPFGIVGLEAMSCGTLLVASDIGGFPEFAQNAAILTPPGNVSALADALEQAISGDGIAGMIRLGRQRVIENYDYRTVGSEYVKLYNEILKLHRR